MRRPDDYLTLYVWGPDAGPRAGLEAPSTLRDHPQVRRIEGPPAYLAAVRELADRSSDPFSKAVGRSVREALGKP